MTVLLFVMVIIETVMFIHTRHSFMIVWLLDVQNELSEGKICDVQDPHLTVQLHTPCDLTEMIKFI